MNSDEILQHYEDEVLSVFDNLRDFDFGEKDRMSLIIGVSLYLALIIKFLDEKGEAKRSGLIKYVSTILETDFDEIETLH